MFMRRRTVGIWMAKCVFVLGMFPSLLLDSGFHFSLFWVRSGALDGEEGKFYLVLCNMALCGMKQGE